MAQSTLKLTIKVAWWLRRYLRGVVVFAWMTGMHPDERKVTYWIRRSIKIKVG